MKTVSVIVEDDLYESLKKIAKEQDLSVSKVAKKVLRVWVDSKKASEEK